MFIYVSSQDSRDIYKGNKFLRFSVELPTELHTQNCELSLKHVWFSKGKGVRGSYYYVFCDAVEPSIVNGKEAPILGSFFQQGATVSDEYHHISTNYIKRLTFNINCSDSEAPSIDRTLYFTLHLREIQ